jgi:hypothetical protein
MLLGNNYSRTKKGYFRIILRPITILTTLFLHRTSTLK